MKKYKLFIIFLFFVLASSIFSERHSLKCHILTEFDQYHEISQNIFVNTNFEVKNYHKIKELIAEGKNRVNHTFGEMNSRPKILITIDKNEAADFGANSTATTHLSPLGVCLVLGPQGQNVDVVAHELVHAEVFQRVGWFNQLIKIPTWFNEGIALIVDLREPFLPNNINLQNNTINSVMNKFYGFQFFADANIHENYQAARLAVRSLEPSLLYQKLSKIREGENFDDVFSLRPEN